LALKNETSHCVMELAWFYSMIGEAIAVVSELSAKKGLL
jgi:hypothetical protein